MKKICFVLFSLIAFTSCSHDFEAFDIQGEKDAQFAKVFADTFGEIAEDQNWGFEDSPIVEVVETRGVNVNRNEWEGKYEVPANVSADERSLVLNEFSKARVGAVNTLNVDWTDYFVYQVYKGETHYKDGYGNDVLGSNQMNHLKVKFGDSDDANDWTSWEYINDFNNGNCTASWGNIYGATLMVNSGTKDFAYHNSTDSKYHTEYIIIAGANIDPSLAGYFYVGFDFYAHGTDVYPSNKNMDVERDWVFNDWIIRISPAMIKGTKRIIAEDLGAADKSDFDYNDVVFDAAVTKESGNLIANIVLQAAGGTLPIYIGGIELNMEVHSLFGVSTSTMVNTINGKITHAPRQFKFSLGSANGVSTYNIKNIKVGVTTPNGYILLVTETGEAPEKICVPITFRWPKERQPIYEPYPYFKNWVSDKSYVWY